MATEFLQRRGGEAIVLVISDRRVLCVRAFLRRSGSSSSRSSNSVNSGGRTDGADRADGNGRSTGGGGSGGGSNGSSGTSDFRGSGITGVELEWQIQLDALTGLPALLDEDGGRTTLDFTHVNGAATGAGGGRRRDGGRASIRHNLHKSRRVAGLASVWASTDVGGGAGGIAGTKSPANQPHLQTGQHDHRSNREGGGHGAVGMSVALPAVATPNAHGGGRALPPRRVEGLYRDRPALIRAYNVVACLTQRFSRVLLTPGGVNVTGSEVVARSHFPPAGVRAVGGASRRNSGNPGVISINGWEFGEEPLEHIFASTTAQPASRGSFGNTGIGMGPAPAFMGFGSPRVATYDRRASSGGYSTGGGGGGGGGGPFDLPALYAPRKNDAASMSRSASTGRNDLVVPRELWMPLWLPMPQRHFAPPDKLRPVINAFEMDAVIWMQGPYAPESDSASGWLCRARVQALEAPVELCRCPV